MVSFAGIGSGLDLEALISGFVSIEKIPIGVINGRISEANQQLSGVGSLVSLLKTVESSAEGLDETNEVRAVSASSSDESFVTATASDAALLGSYDLRVNQLANAQATASQTYTTNTSGIVGTGAIGITVGTNTQVDIVLTGSEDLDGVAALINDSNARVSASVIFDGSSYRLMIQGDDVGSANTISFQENSITMGLNLPGSTITAAQDSLMELNGITVTRSSNTIADLLQGVTLTLNREMAVTDGDVKMRVDNDTEALRGKIEGMTGAVNNVLGFLNLQLSSGAQEGSATSLAGDTTLQGLQRRLMSMLSSGYTHNGSTVSMGNVGIVLGDDGGLSVDSDKFATALQTDPGALQSLFAGDGVTSFSALLKSIVTEYTLSGTGTLVTKQSGLKERIDQFDDQIQRIEERADRMEVRLRRTFTALDVRMAQLNTQATFVASAFGQNNQG